MKFRRFAFSAALASVATVALAQDWTPYANERWGYEVQVPPGFAASEEQLGDDSSRSFVTADGTAELIVTGGAITEGATIVDYAEGYRATLTEAGWALELEEGPEFAVISGTVDGSVLLARLETRCSGIHFAGFVLIYDAAAAAEIEPLIPEIEAGLTEGTCPPIAEVEG